VARVTNRVTIEVKISAEDALDLLDKIDERANDVKPVFRWAQNELERANSRNFGTSGMPVGNWKRLDAQYAAWKAVNIPGAPRMFATGKLFRSLTNMSAHGVSVITDKSAEFGTSVEYAKFHQYGTTKMPKRKIVYTPKEFSRDFRMKTVDHIVEGIVDVERA
jgi:phage gpG-like protein